MPNQERQLKILKSDGVLHYLMTWVVVFSVPNKKGAVRGDQIKITIV